MTKIDLNNVDKSDIRYKHMFFRGGENHIQLTPNYQSQFQLNQQFDVILRYSNDSELFKLALTVDALNRLGVSASNRHLFIPYFPGSRQDRVCNAGEPLSVKVYAEFINSLKFNEVHVLDPHSDVTPALIDNVVVHDNSELVGEVIKVHKTHRRDGGLLVSPDAGSNKKIYSLAKTFKNFFNGVIRCDKIRNVATGEIVRTDVFATEDELKGQTCYIVDDIISGGRTFTEIAKILKERGASKVHLIVTHHEGVANAAALKESGIDHVYTTDSKNPIISDDITTVFSISDLMFEYIDATYD